MVERHVAAHPRTYSHELSALSHQRGTLVTGEAVEGVEAHRRFTLLRYTYRVYGAGEEDIRAAASGGFYHLNRILMSENRSRCRYPCNISSLRQCNLEDQATPPPFRRPRRTALPSCGHFSTLPGNSDAQVDRSWTQAVVLLLFEIKEKAEVNTHNGDFKS